jgi:hypothetical protein
VIAAANRARTASGADQQNALREIQSKSSESLSAVQARIQAQLAAPAAQPSPSVLPASGVAESVGTSPSLLLLGIGFLVVGAGVFGVARLRRTS